MWVVACGWLHVGGCMWVVACGWLLVGGCMWVVACGVHDPLKSSVTGYSLMGTCYLENKINNKTSG